MKNITTILKGEAHEISMVIGILGDVGKKSDPYIWGIWTMKMARSWAELACQIMTAAKDKRGLKNQHAPKLNNN